MYPEYVEIDNKLYKINTDFKIALSCFKVINDKTISDIERTYIIIALLFDEDFPDEYIEIGLTKAKIFLECGKSECNKGTIKKDIDFNQDFHYIFSSFMSDYKIDLDKTEIHWWKFCKLIEGLTEHSILNRVREIRNYDLTQVKDIKQRNTIIQAKEQVALKEELSEKEQEALEKFNAFFDD